MADPEVLLDCVEYDGVKIYPLTLARLVVAAPAIDRARTLATDAGLTEESAVKDPIKLAIILAPVIPELLSIVTDKPVEEVGTWLPDKALGVLIVAMRQNVGYLRNLFGPLLRSAITAVTG